MKFVQLLGEEIKIPKKVLLKFGKILFGSSEFQKNRKKEYDTYDEGEIYIELLKHLNGQRNAETINTFKELLKLKKIYPIILKPTKTTLTRVVGVTKKTYGNVIDQMETYDEDEQQFTSKNFIYKPEWEVESWSTDDGSGFYLYGAKHKKYNKRIEYLFVTAKLPENQILFNHKFLNYVGYHRLDFSNYENEVIRISKETITGKGRFRSSLHWLPKKEQIRLVKNGLKIKKSKLSESKFDWLDKYK